LRQNKYWALNQAVRLSKLGQDTLDDIENGYMSPLDDIGYL